MSQHRISERLDDVEAVDPSRHRECKALSSILVGQSQQPHRPAIMGLGRDNVAALEMSRQFRHSFVEICSVLFFVYYSISLSSLIFSISFVLEKHFRSISSCHFAEESAPTSPDGAIKALELSSLSSRVAKVRANDTVSQSRSERRQHFAITC